MSEGWSYTTSFPIINLEVIFSETTPLYLFVFVTTAGDSLFELLALLDVLFHDCPLSDDAPELVPPDEEPPELEPLPLDD